MKEGRRSGQGRKGKKRSLLYTNTVLTIHPLYSVIWPHNWPLRHRRCPQK